VPASLSLKIGGATAAVVVVALALATLLNALRFQETYERLASERFRFVAAELRTLASISLDFGLQLESNAGLLTALQREAAVDASILAVTIHDCEGEPLLQAGDAAASREPWRQRLGQEEWRTFSGREVGVGLMIRDSIGLCAGGVAVELSGATYTATLAAARHRLLLAAPLALAAIPLVGLFAALVFRRHRRVVAALQQDLDRVEAAEKATPDPAGPAASEALAFDPAALVQARRLAGGDAALGELVSAYAEARPLLHGSVAAGAEAGASPGPTPGPPPAGGSARR